MDIESLLDRYPSIDYLTGRAKARIPHFAWEYLDSGTGLETGLSLNREALNQIRLAPAFMKGTIEPQTGTTVFGQTYSAPVGVAPIGMSGMLWPGSELMLAATARRHNIAYCLSTVGCETLEDVARAGGNNAWFQLYPFVDPEPEADLIDRAASAGFSVLVVTVDVPAPSARERQRKAGSGRAKGGLSRLMQVASRPQWALATARHGAPRFRLIEKYVDDATMQRLAVYIAAQLGVIDLDHLKRIRDRWKGAMVVKGILTEDDARACIEIGADGIVVSNHGARQFDAAPAAIDALAQIAPAIGDKTTILFDSGVRSGLDVARALALGADFVLCGRAFLYSVAALGADGAELAAHLLISELRNNMIQLGCTGMDQLTDRLEPR